MKTLYMIFSKLKAMIAGEKLFFAVFCIGILTCNLMFTYMYGVFMQLGERDGIADMYLYYVDGERMSVADMDNILTKGKYELDYYVLLNPETCFYKDDTAEIRWEDYSIRAKKDYTSFFTRTGSIHDLANPNCVIVPEEIASIGVGDTICLNGVSFSVVGTSAVSSFIISAESIAKNGWGIDVFGIDVPIKDNGVIQNQLEQAVSSTYWIEQMPGVILDRQTFLSLGVVVMIYLLCMLSFMYLMTFLYDSVAYELNVYEILGATRGRILAVLSGVMFLLLSGVSLVSQIVYAMFYESFFGKLNMFGEFSYSIGDYAAVFALTMILVYAFVFVYICIRTGRSTIQNSRKFVS